MLIIKVKCNKEHTAYLYIVQAADSKSNSLDLASDQSEIPRLLRREVIVNGLYLDCLLCRIPYIDISSDRMLHLGHERRILLCQR